MTVVYATLALRAFVSAATPDGNVPFNEANVRCTCSSDDVWGDGYYAGELHQTDCHITETLVAEQ